MDDFENLYHTWNENPHWWFSASSADDDYITNTYYSLVRNIRNNIDFWSNVHNVYTHQSWQSIIGLIIACDQVPHHIARVQTTYDDNHDLKTVLLNRVAFPLSKHIIDSHPQLWLNNAFNSFDMVFILLPLRHTKDYTQILLAAKHAFSFLVAQQKKDPSNQDIHLLKRFLTATFQNAPYVSQAHLFTHTWSPDCDFTNHWCSKVCDQTAWDLFAQSYLYNDGRAQFTCIQDLYRIPSHITNKIKCMCSQLNIPEIIISLSGGVDSIVLATLLVIVTRHYNMNISVKAVHINYMNRANTVEEEEFVVQFCVKFLGIPCVVRRISEIQRQQCADIGLREMYEDYTRNVRFGTYLNAAEVHNKCVVCLGHNQDDVVENVICNIASKSKINNLNGMSFYEKYTHGDKVMDITINENLTILRPFINVAKTEIYDMARQLNLPFLKNTTRPGCTRYFIRNNLRPHLDQFSAIPGLLALSQSCYELSNVMLSFIDSILKHQVVRDTDYIHTDEFVYCHLHIPSKHPLLTCCSFAKEFFCHIFTQRTAKGNQIPFYTSQKSLKNYLHRILHFKPGHIQKVMLTAHHMILVQRSLIDDNVWTLSWKEDVKV